MRNNSSEVSFYVDSLIIETILKDEKLYKQADAGGMVTSLIDKVKSYVESHIDPHDKSGSLINILGPGVISVAFASMGIGWLGALIGLSIRVFNINVKNIISSIWSKLKPAISGDKEVSSEIVDSFVTASVQENYQPATPEEAEKAAGIMKAKATSILTDAKFVKIAMINFQNGTLTKEAAFFDMFNSRKTKTANILTRVLSWIFKIALASAGLMVAGDVVNKFLNRPNAIDGTIQKGHPVATTPSEPVNVSKQNKFPIKPGYVAERYNLGDSNWSEGISNDSGSIENMLIDFANHVYDGLEGKDNIIKNSPAFQVVKDRIVWYNHTSPYAPLVWLPKYFSSKKQIVDHFIDDVADRTTT